MNRALCNKPMIPLQVLLALALLALTACATGRAAQSVASAEAGRYNHTMHNRFYEAWSPPRSVDAPPGKLSVPVDVWIDRAGYVLRFKILEPSGNLKIDRSILDVGEKITRVTPPPVAASHEHFDLLIYFELDVKR